MPKKFVFETEVKRNVTCASCGTHYYYLHKVRSEEKTPEAATASGRKQMANGFSWVPCPRCGKMTAQMRRGHRIAGLFIVPAGILALFGGYFAWMQLAAGQWFNTGAGIYALATPLAIPGALLIAGFALAWPFMPRFNQGVIPGEEDKLPPKLRARIEAFNRNPAGEPQVRPA